MVLQIIVGEISISFGNDSVPCCKNLQVSFDELNMKDDFFIPVGHMTPKHVYSAYNKFKRRMKLK